MLHCQNTSRNLAGSCSSVSDITVFERQRVRMKWQQHQTGFNGVFSSSQHSQGSTIMNMMTAADSGSALVGEVVAHSSMKPDPRFNQFQMPTGAAPVPGFDVNSAISRTFSCPPTLAEAEVTDSSIGKESSKKRKAEKAHNPKVVAEKDNKDKRIKIGAEDGESKITGQPCAMKNTRNANSNNKENCADTSNSKENSKASEVQKPDYIHVRARRGQATDSHSLAERVRREKISERMKYLQDLVPGCNKITGKAGMLDEIINYVQSLQRQVEVFPTCDANANFQAMGMSSEMNNHPFLQFNSPEQIVSYGGLDTGMNPSDMEELRRTISAPVTMPETFIDSSSFSQILPSTTWEGDFQNIYNLTIDQARATSFPSHLFTGLAEASILKMEM